MSAGTYFYNRTAYILPELTLPTCFENLDARFSGFGLTTDESYAHPLVILAEHLCRRMSHVELNAHLIESTLAEARTVFEVSEIVGTLVVGHVSSRKSFLDAIALVLNSLHDLNLRGGDLDMNKGKYWSTLRTRDPNVAARFEKHRGLIHAISDWRDVAVHRVAPVTIADVWEDPDPASTGMHKPYPGSVIRSFEGEGDNATVPPVELKLCLVPEIDNLGLYKLIGRDRDADKLGYPLHFHRLWHDQLLDLCCLACDSIATAVQPPTD